MHRSVGFLILDHHNNLPKRDEDRTARFFSNQKLTGTPENSAEAWG